jgi:nitrate/nitrite-specific signal transduction histidine kinase
MTEEHRELRRLKWIAILSPLVFLGLLELARQLAAPEVLRAWPGYILIAGLVLIGTLFFAETIFGVIGRMQDRLRTQNRELLALHDAAIDITSELNLELVLQRVVDQARELGGAQYGALSILGESGRIDAFLTSGISPEVRARIGPIPQGHGLLGAVIDEGVSLRIPDLTVDRRSVGFPPNHPPMRSLLAVPVRSHGHILGSLYLTEKLDAPEFSEHDMGRLERFATQAAIAIDNANLHRQVESLAIAEERGRIAREMHDSIAQVLGYVNIKAQAIEEHLRRDQPDRAVAQLEQLSQAARAAYADVREDILGLRTSLDGDAGLIAALEDYLKQWSAQSDIEPELRLVPNDIEDLDIEPLVELQLMRIIQESLANVRKYAHASAVRVELERTEDQLRVAIHDNGIGFDREKVAEREFPRFGLTMMRERAQSIEGEFDIQTKPGHGTSVRVSVPLRSRLRGSA